MTSACAARCNGAIALADLLDDALAHLVPPRASATPPAPPAHSASPAPAARPEDCEEARESAAVPAQTAPPASDGFLYSGKHSESVPRALLFDRRLTPLERNAWQVLRLHLNDGGMTALPVYEQLRPCLTSMPCAAQASDETVARALTLLRLTRWLSLARRSRDPGSGRILGNVHVLHDEPLTPFEAMQIDPDYLALVGRALTHAARAVQIVGQNTLREIASDPLLAGRTLPARLRPAQPTARVDSAPQSYPQAEGAQESEEGPQAPLRIPKTDSTVPSTVRTYGIKEEVRTVLSTKMFESLKLPERFGRLKADQQSGALKALQQVEQAQRQPVLDEWAARCRASQVHNPAGYLFGIIRKAAGGAFKAWAGVGKGGGNCGPPAPQMAAATPVPDPPQPPSPAPKGSGLEMARAYLARLRTGMPDP